MTLTSRFWPDEMKLRCIDNARTTLMGNVAVNEQLIMADLMPDVVIALYRQAIGPTNDIHNVNEEYPHCNRQCSETVPSFWMPFGSFRAKTLPAMR